MGRAEARLKVQALALHASPAAVGGTPRPKGQCRAGNESELPLTEMSVTGLLRSQRLAL